MSVSIHHVIEKSSHEGKQDQPDKENGLIVEQTTREHSHLTVGDLLRGTGAHELTQFERKAALINDEIDKFGFGRYQQYIWLLCGFGYFADLAWAQGVALMATAMYQELDVPPGSQGQIYACSNAGLAVGALTFGLISDIFGRKWAFNSSCLITSVFGMILAASNNYAAVCGIYFIASFGLGGNIPIDATIALEFLPQNRRSLVSLLSIWQPIGIVIASAIAYGTTAHYRCSVTLPACSSVGAGTDCCSRSSNMGWRYQLIAIGGMTLAIFFLRFAVFRFYESPKFLLSKGREQAAIDVLHKIAAFNGCPSPTLTVEDFRAVEIGAGAQPTEETNGAGAKKVIVSMFKELGFLRGLFLRKLELVTFILLAFAYMGDYWSFNLAGYFLPIVLLQNNVSSGATNATETYRQYIYIYLPGILGAVIALFSIQLPLVGRKWSLVISAALQGLSMAMYTQVKTTAGYVGLNALEYIMQTYFNAVLYASAPEMFDTSYRASASGMLSCLGRLAGIVAPFAGERYISSSSGGILWLGAGGIWFSALVICFLPIEMRNRKMY